MFKFTFFKVGTVIGNFIYISIKKFLKPIKQQPIPRPRGMKKSIWTRKLSANIPTSATN